VTGPSTVISSEQCTSLPYGDNLSCTGTDVNQLQFTGQERDSESTNDYFNARYYASNIASRFLTPDPYNGSYAVIQEIGRPPIKRRIKFQKDYPHNFQTLIAVAHGVPCRADGAKLYSAPSR